MDLSLVSKNLKQLASTDLELLADDAIKAQIVAATQQVGPALSHHVVPQTSRGFSFHQTEADPASKIVALAGTGFMGFSAEIDLYPSYDVIIYEPLPGLAYLFLSQMNLADFCGTPNVHLYYQLDRFEAALRTVQNFWRPIQAYKSPSTSQLFPEETDRFQKIIVEYSLIVRNEIKALEKYYFRWTRNEALNLQQLKGKPNAATRREFLKNTPAIIVGAGPSLRPALTTLKAVSQADNILIIAASTAIRALLAEGIYPHFVVIIEGRRRDHFDADLAFNRLRLLAHMQTHPDHLNYPFQGVYWFNQGTSPLAPLIAALLPETVPIQFSGNVATTAFLLAAAWGCNPVALVGMDLAYKPEKRYMQGLGIKEHAVDASNLQDVPGQGGETLQAPPEWMGYARNLEKAISSLKTIKPGFSVVNASIGGRVLKGTVEMPLAEFVAQHPAPSDGVGPRILQELPTWPNLPVEQVQAVLDQRHAIYRTLAETLESPASQLEQTEHLNRIASLLQRLPEFNTPTARLIPWVPKLLAGQPLSPDDLAALKTAVEQVLAKP